jgi:hypothetical protein
MTLRELLMDVRDDLKELTFERYKIVINTFVNTIRNYSFVKSVYQFGKIRNPGISDIDLLIIVKHVNDCSNDNVEKIYAATKSSPISRYCFWHNPIIVAVEELDYLYTFHTVCNLHILYGKDILNEYHVLTTNEYIQPYWNVFFIEVSVSLLASKTVSLRLLLLVLNNILFSIKENDAILHTRYAPEISKDVKNIRGDILTNGRKCSGKNDAIELLSRSLVTIRKQETYFDLPVKFRLICSNKYIYVTCPHIPFRYFPQWRKISSKIILILPARYFTARTLLFEKIQRLSDKKGLAYTNFLLKRLTFPSAFGLFETPTKKDKIFKLK